MGSVGPAEASRDQPTSPPVEPIASSDVVTLTEAYEADFTEVAEEGGSVFRASRLAGSSAHYAMTFVYVARFGAA